MTAKPKAKTKRKPTTPEQLVVGMIEELREKIDQISATLVEIEHSACVLERHVARDRDMERQRRFRSRRTCC